MPSHRLRLCAAFAIALIATTAVAAPGVESQVQREVDARYETLFSLYRDLHQHPELGFHEAWTAARLAGEMRRLGFTVSEHVGGTGMVAIFENGTGPTVLVRTELDALPLEEKTHLPYASLVTDGTAPAMHACGHDVHMAAWVGTAQVLVALKDRWHGRLMFVAQPAEEGGGGAKAMLADGLLTRFPRPDLGFALHVGPSAAGTVSLKSGVDTSASDSVEIVFKGRGGHGSMPSATIDPIVIAARFVTDVQTVISREKDAAEFGVITVGAFQAGTAANIIPDSALLKLTLRSYSPSVRRLLVEGVRRVALASAQAANAPAPEIRVGEGYSAVVSDDAIAKRTARVFERAFGPAFALSTAPVAASEDYSEFINAGIPSLFFHVGVSDPAAIAAAAAGGPPVPANHSPYFAPVPEPSIKTAIKAMTLAVIESSKR